MARSNYFCRAESNLNAFAERFIESLKTECVGESCPSAKGTSARPSERCDHYHEERSHQGLNNDLIAPKATLIEPGPVPCRHRLGGLLTLYHREAA